MTGGRAADLLRLVHDEPGITRVAASERLGTSSGATADLVGRLVGASLLAETPVPPSGRGRPTTALGPHPAGPVVLALSVTFDEWRVHAGELGGGWVAAESGEHLGESADVVLGRVLDAARRMRRRMRGRVRATALSMPGIVEGPVLRESGHLGWYAVDLTRFSRRGEPFVTGNDATFAGSAEARRGAASGSQVSLHVRVDAGIGGGLVAHGRTALGATGVAGEFGHLPLGDPAQQCPCGASGCWGEAVSGRELSRLLGEPADDPVELFRDVVRRGRAGHAASSAALAVLGTTLGRGTAGLVNALDPDVVTVGGLGVGLLDVVRGSFDDAYLAGLMRFRRDAPTPVVPAALGEDGPLLGAAEEAWLRVWDGLAG